MPWARSLFVAGAANAASHTREQCARWAREANTASYRMIAAVSVAIMAASWIYRNRGWI
jgi:hypothetical protein